MWVVTLGGVRTCARASVAGLAAAIILACGAVAVASQVLASSFGIDTYLIEAEIGSDGSLAVTESITFESGSTVPDGFSTRLAAWQIPDQPDRIQTLNVRVDEVGSDPAQITATYTVTGAFRAFTEAELADGNPLGLTAGDAEIFAEVIGPLPDVPIGEARVQVRTPGAALAAACFVDGRSIPVCTDRIGDDQTTFRALDLAPGASMTIALVIDGATVTIPEAPDPPSNAEGFPWTLALAFTGAAGLIAIVVVVRSRSREG